MKINVMLGQDMSAYADVELDVPDGASKEEIIERVQEFADSEDFNEVVFDEDWSTTCALRIVSIKIGNDLLLEEVSLEPSPFDAGQVLQSWLRGYGPSLKTVINAAVEAALIDHPEMEVYRGTLKVGNEIVNVQFEARKGATREEKDLAFFEALMKSGKFNCGYETVGV